MSNNTGIDKGDLSYTPPENERFRVMPSTDESPKKPFPRPFPNIQVVEQQNTPYFDGLRENERSLISNNEHNEHNEHNEKKKGGSLKRKKRLSYKKKRITRKMRKSHRNKKHYK